MSDPMGEAIRDYFVNRKAPDLNINTNYTENETIPVSFFFRTFDEMPEIEKQALDLSAGRILDVGAAAGCHSLILQKRGFSVTALDKSVMAADVMIKRGIKNVICQDILKYDKNQFDTILILMNGTGIGGTVKGLKKLLVHLKKLLKNEGQILIDSSDIKYLFYEEDGSVWFEPGKTNYYGEMVYELRYKNTMAKFNWLFVDFDTLNKTGKSVGFKCEKTFEGLNHDYLARLF